MIIYRAKLSIAILLMLFAAPMHCMAADEEPSLSGSDPQLSPSSIELFAAIQAGDSDRVEKLLASGASPSSTDKEMRSPLHYAALAGNTRSAELLLAKGASIGRRDSDGITPLHDAAAQGNLAMTQLLLEHGAKVDAIGNDGVTPLHLAAMSGNVEVARLLLSHGATLELTGAGAMTPDRLRMKLADVDRTASAVVFAAAFTGGLVGGLIAASVMNAMQIGKKGDPSIPPQAKLPGDGKYQASPLLFAAWNNDLPMVQHLLGKGAIPANSGFHLGNRKCFDIECDLNPAHYALTGDALGLAVSHNNIAMAKELLDHGASLTDGPFSPWVRAASLGQIEMVRLFLEHGAKPDVRLYDGLTPLHLAAAHGQIAVAEALLAAGANVNDIQIAPIIPNNFLHSFADANIRFPMTEKGTPLHMAALNGQSEMVALLIAHGADIHALARGDSTNKFTPLDIAIGSEMLKFPRAKNAVGGDPLFENAPAISTENRIAIVNQLIAKGAKLDTKRLSGISALHMAAKLGSPELVALLLDHGAEINARDKGSMSPLQYAEQAGNTATADLLRQRGAL